MRKQQTSEYIELGDQIRFLMGIWTGYAIHGADELLAALDTTMELLDRLGFVVTRRLATHVQLDALREQLRATEPGATLNERDAKRLRVIATQIRQTVTAEGSGLFAYVTGGTRLDAEKLLDDPASLFAPDVFDSLSAKAQTDVAEAFKCLALERATAAAFHLMRATEESLRRFYGATVGTAGGKERMWHPMTEDLRKQPTPPPDALLAQLDHIRRNFRNPTQHPDAVYDLHEAEDLAFLTIDVLGRLARGMRMSGDDVAGAPP
jgi:hypothetical protein